MVFNIQEIDLAVIGHETETPHEEGKQQRPMGGGGATARHGSHALGGQPHNPPALWPCQPVSKQPVHILSRCVCVCVCVCVWERERENRA